MCMNNIVYIYMNNTINMHKNKIIKHIHKYIIFEMGKSLQYLTLFLVIYINFENI